MASINRKPLQFVGSSHNDLRTFPDEARREAGFNLDFVQRGFDPENWKPMKTVGTGAALLSEENGKDESTRYRLGQDAIQGDTEVPEEMSDEEAHTQ